MDWSPPPLQASKEWSPPALIAPAVPTPPKAEVRLTKVAAVGWHVHRCSRGHEWSHTDASYGNRNDHSCPVCGEISWNPTHYNMRIVETKPVQAVKPVPRVLLPANP